MTSVLTTKNLVKRYGDRLAVDGISFEIQRGECYGLLGPNGAGKTTTISMACGLLARDNGEVYINGIPLTHRSIETKKYIGYVPQDLALYPEISVSDNLRFFGKLYGLVGEDLEKRVDQTLEIVGLKDRKKDKVASFSGGMKRRANIAAGLLHKPSLLVLDEPTVGVDPQSRNAILEAVSVLGDEGMAILYTTHYMEEAERLCDRIGIVDLGKIVEEGTKEELVEKVGTKDRIRIGIRNNYELAVKILKEKEPSASLELGNNFIGVSTENAPSKLPDLAGILVSNGVEISSLVVVEPNLEAVFLKLTGKELRD